MFPERPVKIPLDWNVIPPSILYSSEPAPPEAVIVIIPSALALHVGLIPERLFMVTPPALAIVWVPAIWQPLASWITKL